MYLLILSLNLMDVYYCAVYSWIKALFTVTQATYMYMHMYNYVYRTLSNRTYEEKNNLDFEKRAIFW